MTTPPADQNLAPVNTVPGSTRSATTAVALPFTGANQLSITDATSATAMTVTLTPGNGTLAVTKGTGNATVNVTGGVYTLTGSVTDVNAALLTLTFTGTAAGPGTITMATVDAGGLRDDDVINITVADAVNQVPVNTVPGAAQTAIAGASKVIAGISVDDPENSGTMTVTLTAVNGKLSATAGGATVNGQSGAVLTISGSESAVNTALGTLAFTGDAAGAATITMVSADGAGGTDTDTINITVGSPANVAPVNTVPGTAVSAVAGVAKAVTGLSVADTDSASVTVTLTPAGGSLTAAAGGGGASVTANSGIVTISGSIANVNTALGTVAYTGSATGVGSITMVTSDGAGGSDTDTVSVSIGANQAPVNTVPATTPSAAAGQARQITGVTVNDAEDSASMTVTLSAANGKLDLTAGGATVTGKGSGSLTVSGTEAAVQTALGTLTFTGTDAAPASITMVSGDGAGGTDTDTINITVVANQAPVNSVPGPVPDAVSGQVKAISGISVDDPDDSISLTVVLEAVNGTVAVTAGGASVAGQNTGKLTLTGSESAVNTALGTLGFAGTAAGAGSITVKTTDGAGASDTDTVNITVAAGANVAPVTTVPAGTVSAVLNSALSLSGANLISVSDVNVGDTITMDLVTSNGTLSVSGAGAAGNGTGALTLTGTVATVNGLLSSLALTPNALGAATISIATSDGAGGTDSDIVTLTVAAAQSNSGGGGGGGNTGTTTTVGNTTVTTQQQTDSSGAIVVTTTVAPVPAGSSVPVSVPLSGSGAAPTLQAQLPAGTGLSVTGRSEPQAPAAVNTLLSTEVTRLVPDGALRADITTAVTSYVAGLPETAAVTVRTVAPTVTGTTAPAAPIVISGQAGGTGATTQEALVIDTRSLPAGTVLQIQNVEFAVLVGPVRAIGGEGNNFVVGDASPQEIVLGADDDTLRGGAGDDTVGSGAGNDLISGDDGNDMLFGGAGDDTLSGGAGNDTVTLTGARNAYAVTPGANGVTVRHLDGGADGTDLLQSVERIAFSGGSAALGELAAREMLLQRANGELLTWNQTQGASGFQSLLTLTGGSALQGAGDYTGDGRGDLLFRIDGGATLLWDVSKGALGFTELRAVPLLATLRTGNFVGAAGDDLLAQQANGVLTFVDGTTGAATPFLTLNPGFSVLGTGDIDGGGRDDVVFRNDETGGVFAWTGQGFANLLNLGADWQVAAMGKFVGGDADDFLFFNTGSRALLFWDATQGAAGFQNFVTLPTNWGVAGIGDVNGDGRDDVVLRNETSGEAIFWTGSGFGYLGTVLGAVSLAGIGDLAT